MMGSRKVSFFFFFLQLISNVLTVVGVPSAYSYRIDSKLSPSADTVSSLAIIKTGPIDENIPLDAQLQAITLPNSQIKSAETSSNPYEILHSMLHFAIAPYFEAFCKSTSADKDNEVQDDGKLGGIPITRKKIAELELSFLHLQQNVEIPELTLGLHPVIERAVGDGTRLVSVNDIPQELLSDTSFLNSLQSIVNNWIKSIQGITKITRDPHNGTATQEINFWLSLELALKNIEDQLQGPGVTLTLEVLKNAKRFHATVSFLSDTGVKEASEQVAKYNQLMRDFPLDELISATSLNKIQQALVQVFSHLNKKLRVTPYPVWRALALVEAISADLDNTLRSILGSKRLMHLDFGSLKSVMQQTTDIFTTWDDCAKEFTNIAREVTRKRSEKFIPIRISPRQLRTKERLEYIQGFRKRHEELQRTLTKVLGTEGRIVASGEDSIIPPEFEGISPLQEVEEAYDVLKDVDALDTSEGKFTLFHHSENHPNNEVWNLSFVFFPGKEAERFSLFCKKVLEVERVLSNGMDFSSYKY
jgi:dynein heavy chain 1